MVDWHVPFNSLVLFPLQVWHDGPTTSVENDNENDFG